MTTAAELSVTLHCSGCAATVTVSLDDPSWKRAVAAFSDVHLDHGHFDYVHEQRVHEQRVHEHRSPAMRTAG